jgi:hypothetical protein
MSAGFAWEQGRAGKDFFFEKKQQKTLADWAAPNRDGRSQVCRGFLLFFSKKKAFLAALPALL